MYKVVERLKMIIIQSNITIDSHQNKSFDGINDVSNESIDLNLNDNPSYGELSRIIQNFDKINTKELIESLMTSQNDLSIIVDEIVTFIFKGLNEGKFLDFLNNQNITLHEIYNWLSNNQSDSNSIFLFGCFNFLGIETNENHEKAFNLFINASKQNTEME